MRTFEYQRPASLPDVLAALAAPESRVLAGGMSLIPSMKLRLATPDTLVDLHGVGGLDTIAVTADAVTVGAMTTHAAVADSVAVQVAIPALAALAGGIGDPQVRNRGTLGGALFDLAPGSAWPAALLATGAAVHTTARVVDAEHWCSDAALRAALAVDEIVTAVHIPLPQAAVLRDFKPVPGRLALVSVFVALRADQIRIGVSGYARTAFRSEAAARWWTSGEAAGIAWEHAPVSDLHGDADYRAAIALAQLRQARLALVPR